MGLSPHNPLSTTLRRRSVAANRPTWKTLFQRLLDGPGIQGHVRDIDGNPLEAEVRILEQCLKQGERWTSRSRDGRFDRVVPASGTYTVEVSLSGYATAQKRVTVQSGATTVEFALRPLKGR